MVNALGNSPHALKSRKLGNQLMELLDSTYLHFVDRDASRRKGIESYYKKKEKAANEAPRSGNEAPRSGNEAPRSGNDAPEEEAS